MASHSNQRGIYGWALYDWANSAFATTVMAGFFPVFFKQVWNAGEPAALSTFRLGLTNSLASLIVMLAAPLIGAVADQLGRRKGALLIFTALGVLMTGSLAWIQAGHWELAALAYGLAVIGFSGSNLFYDALLIYIAPLRDVDRISSLGFALGYLGGGLLFSLNLLMTWQPEWFGLADRGEAVRVAFISVAVWWAVFSLPLLLWVHEPGTDTRPSLRTSLVTGWRQLLTTLREVRALPEAFIFLLAYWFYIDGVGTIIRMAVDYGLSLGFPDTSLVTALLITQFVGFPATLVFGRLGGLMGTRNAIYLALGLYMLITLWGAFMSAVWEFYLLAAGVGLVQGGVQALSRSLFARLIPLHQSAELFGFYNMLGKFAAVLGPLLMGTVVLATGSPRVGIVSVLLLFVTGFWLLSRVDIERGEARVARIDVS
ncbi:MFS transporter [Thiohalobacter thiocyanaticus]|uniref:MFS transporter n=1 Tax=Thiohalobacter thiocyanaticus TaxID=585455 RepID=A0A426QL40_9GAMM|nr:MFS transporter [Thiohalobacter thiocyanaticus]RRQ22406.1 MFS transporter [Thiohalobacter thiocyanaticus]